MVHKDSIQDWVETNLVLDHLGLDLVSEVVIDGVLHVVRLEVILKSLLVDKIVLKSFHHHVETPITFMGIETYLENTVAPSGLPLCNFKLILKNIVQDLLHHRQTSVENNIAKLRAPKHALLHFLQFDIFKAKDLLRVVVCDGCSLHTANFHLHDVFQETATNQIVVFTLE